MKHSKKISLLITLFICFDTKSQSISSFDFEKFSHVPKFLSDYGFFKDLKNQKPVSNVHPIPTRFVNSAGKIKDVRYRAPNQNQCKECHQLKKVMTPIGPKARNMNKLVEYDAGEMNQLVYWAALGWINENLGSTSISNYADVNAVLNERARAYLDINCGHCHIPGGSADTTGLYLNFTEQDKEQIGIYKKPVAAGRASGNLKYSIVPGHPEDSILLYRMKSLDPGIMMPESGRALSDETGIKLITDWIDKL